MSTQKITKLGLILNTRPAHYHERFHEAFGDLPWAIFDCPLTRPEPIGCAIPSPESCDALIFTSQIGVNLFWPGPGWSQKPVLAVGEATAMAAGRAGYTDILQTGENVGDLRAYLADSSVGHALYPSAEEVTADLSQEFPGRVERVATYKMAPRKDLPLQLLEQVQRMRVVVPLFSHRNAEILAELFGKAGITKNNSMMIAVGLSADVFADVVGPWQDQVAAPRPTMKQLVTVTEMVISRMNI